MMQKKIAKRSVGFGIRRCWDAEEGDYFTGVKDIKLDTIVRRIMEHTPRSPPGQSQSSHISFLFSPHIAPIFYRPVQSTTPDGLIIRHLLHTMY